MKLTTKVVLAVAVLVFAFAGNVFAQYPQKALSYVIPFDPGGESDIFARAQQPLLEKALGQKVIVSYKIGGGGAVGWADLVKTRPDGYVFMGYNLPHIILQPLQRTNTGYATLDIKPVYTFMSTPCVLAVSTKSPFKTIEDLVKFAKANPGAVSIGGSGSATANHLAQVIFNKMAGINTTYIPFTGTGDAMPALLGGHVSALMTYTTMGNQYAADVRILAVAADARVPSLPNAATFKELGYNLVEGAYRGIAVPPNTPEAIIKVLADACAKVNNDPEFSAKMAASGFILQNYGPKESEALVAEKMLVYKDIVKDLVLR